MVQTLFDGKGSNQFHTKFELVKASWEELDPMGRFAKYISLHAMMMKPMISSYRWF